MGRGSYNGGGTLLGWSNPNAVIFRAKKQRGAKLPSKAPALSKHEIGQHFRTALRSRDQVLDELIPAVLANVKGGARSSMAMASALNRQGLRTAIGARWTPQLAKHLMDLTFERVRRSGSETTKSPVDPRHRAKDQTPSIAFAPRERANNETHTLTNEEMALRLSRLGRIASSD